MGKPLQLLIYLWFQVLFLIFISTLCNKGIMLFARQISVLKVHISIYIIRYRFLNKKSKQTKYQNIITLK